jgi:hypothetical protein
MAKVILKYYPNHPGRPGLVGGSLPKGSGHITTPVSQDVSTSVEHGVRHIVDFMNSIGITTVASCQGHPQNYKDIDGIDSYVGYAGDGVTVSLKNHLLSKGFVEGKANTVRRVAGDLILKLVIREGGINSIRVVTNKYMPEREWSRLRNDGWNEWETILSDFIS